MTTHATPEEGAQLGDDIATRKTYRYLRLGMVGAVLLLGVSVLLEITLFAVFWSVQTRELWHNTVRPD